jgi:hypothetical protein
MDDKQREEQSDNFEVLDGAPNPLRDSLWPQICIGLVLLLLGLVWMIVLAAVL